MFGKRFIDNHFKSANVTRNNTIITNSNATLQLNVNDVIFVRESAIVGAGWSSDLVDSGYNFATRIRVEQQDNIFF